MRISGLILASSVLGVGVGSQLGVRIPDLFPPTLPIVVVGKPTWEAMPGGIRRIKARLKVNYVCDDMILSRQFRDEAIDGPIYADPIRSSSGKTTSAFRSALAPGEHEVWADYNPEVLPAFTTGQYSVLLSASGCSTGVIQTYSVLRAPYDWRLKPDAKLVDGPQGDARGSERDDR